MAKVGSVDRPVSSARRRRKKAYLCSCCGTSPPFCWTCPCGFQIC